MKQSRVSRFMIPKKPRKEWKPTVTVALTRNLTVGKSGNIATIQKNAYIEPTINKG